MPPNSPSALPVGLIGFGSIGQQIARGVATGAGGQVRLVGVLVARDLPRATAAPVFTDFAAFRAARPAVVLEAASAAACAAYAEPLLASGASMVAASGAALLDGHLRARIEAACQRSGARLYLPAGGVAGLDALAAASAADLGRVALRVTQPGRDVRMLFSGDALAAARQFPDRLNLAVTTAMAAGCPVHLELHQRPGDQVREIELTASGAFGDLLVRVHPRPEADRLSHIVALSLLATLRRIQAPIQIG